MKMQKKDPKENRIMPRYPLYRAMVLAFFLGSILYGSVEVTRDDSWDAENFYVRLKNGEASQAEIIEFLSNPYKIKEIETYFDQTPLIETISVVDQFGSVYSVKERNKVGTPLKIGDDRYRYEPAHNYQQITFPEISESDASKLWLSIAEQRKDSTSMTQGELNDILQRAIFFNRLLKELTDNQASIIDIIRDLPPNYKVTCTLSETTKIRLPLGNNEKKETMTDGTMAITSESPVRLIFPEMNSFYLSFGLSAQEIANIYWSRTLEGKSSVTYTENFSNRDYENQADFVQYYNQTVQYLIEQCNLGEESGEEG